MKTIKLWLTAIAALLCSLTASAHDFEVDGIYYTVTSSADLTVEVASRGYNTYSGTVTIPSTVTYNSKTYSVTSIESYAFYNCSSLLEVFILGDPSVDYYYAFYNCHSNCEVYHPSDMITFESGTSEYGEPHKVSFTNKLKAYTATLKDYELESNAGTHTTNLVFSYFGGGRV